MCGHEVPSSIQTLINKKNHDQEIPHEFEGSFFLKLNIEHWLINIYTTFFR